MLEGNLTFDQSREIAMFKTVFAAVALFAVPAVASAEAAPKQTFSYDGVDYAYTVETKGDVRVLKGSADKGSVPFELRVAKGGVSGYINNSPVSFSLKDVQPLNAKLLVASR